MQYSPQMMFLMETRSKEKAAAKFAQSMLPHFSRNKLILGDGFSGGIWSFWSPGVVSLVQIEESSQHVTFRASLLNRERPDFFITAIYASSNWRKRRQLWSQLTEFHQIHVSDTVPWLLLGDFNSILDSSEKLGGRLDPFVANSKEFKDFVSNTQLLDLGFVGTKFTWSNNRMGMDRILEHLDRGLGNYIWVQSFGSHVSKHLAQIVSDTLLWF